MPRGVHSRGIHYDSIQKLLELKNGEFFKVDTRSRGTFKTTLNNYIKRHPVEKGVEFKSVAVSKDYVYFFRVDKSLRIGEFDQQRNFKMEYV